ncbi:MAG TPA: hypothetical protein PKJ37_07990 [Acidobacteriota bacterium]|nr:hypothetical protein [Acidobacteriota bacterium]HNT17815.1 hypothetical protein [Acidobacteriota bacterium]
MGKKSKGIFCLEVADWSGNMKKRETVKPILDLLRNSALEVPYIYRDVATQGELSHYLGKWTQNKYRDYPILYLAFHGSPGEIFLAGESGRTKPVGFDVFLESLEDSCHGQLIYFGACSFLNVPSKILRNMVRKFDALAVAGYRYEVDWVKSTVFETLFLSELQKNAMTKSGILAVERRIKETAPRLIRELGFRMVIKE